MPQWSYSLSFLFLAVSFITGVPIFAQEVKDKKQSLDSFLLRQKGIIGELANNLMADTLKEIDSDLLRNDIPFQPYKDLVIRHIKVQALEFGVSIADTSKRSSDKLKRLADKLHSDTREFVIGNNLFFAEGEKLSPYLLGDNEKHLRDLSFLQDAKIKVIPVMGTGDSVDILVLTKDVFSLGGSYKIHSSKSLALAVSEDNFNGRGDKIQVQGLIDLDRERNLGYGFEFINRNMGGSFVNAAIGLTTYNRSFSNGRKEETNVYLRLTRPLVNRCMKWTYGAEMELHETDNYYNTDSLYQQDFKYKYNQIDAWGAWNIDADKTAGNNDKARIRRLIGLRVLQQNFWDKPLKYTDMYNYAFADQNAVLASISIFRQNFYKTQYIYGFGRNEDVPEGIDISFTTGWTKNDGRERHYTGINFNHYYFTGHHDYLNISFGSGGYFYKRKLEDIDVVGKIEFFTRLHYLKRNWKQRIFLSASATRQFNNLLSEPLRLESEYGLQELRNNRQGGDYRISGKMETVFFSPGAILYFRFAPFLFVNSTLIHLKVDSVYENKLFSSIGAGLRIRNESLIFGTIELRGMFFPRKNFYNENWRFEARTKIRFKYNQEFIKRPEFVRVN
jgi:hypothetical protein